MRPIFQTIALVMSHQPLSRLAMPHRLCTSAGSRLTRMPLYARPSMGMASSADPAAVRKQVEYYFSDENLRHDAFLQTQISANKDGWLPLEIILSFNKMKSLQVSPADVELALKDSPLEITQAPICNFVIAISFINSPVIRLFSLSDERAVI
jgi:La domain